LLLFQSVLLPIIKNNCFIPVAMPVYGKAYVTPAR
jgi:hypothetical protein